MTESFIDINRIVQGMERINQEKAEIKTILQFLIPSLREIALEEFVPELIHADKSGSNDEIFIVTDQAENFLKFGASVGWRDDDEVMVRLLFGSKGTKGVQIIANNTITSDGIRSEDVGTCHALLRPLIEEVCARWPEVLDKLGIYCAAATRARTAK